MKILHIVHRYYPFAAVQRNTFRNSRSALLLKAIMSRYSPPKILRSFLRYDSVGEVFPGTWLFDRIMMGYWDHRDSREVECLSGACMMMRRDELGRMGPLDAIPLRLIIIFGSFLRIALALIGSYFLKDRSAQLRSFARKYAKLLLWALGVISKDKILKALRS